MPLSGFELATQWSEDQHATAGLRRPPRWRHNIHGSITWRSLVTVDVTDDVIMTWSWSRDHLFDLAIYDVTSEGPTHWGPRVPTGPGKVGVQRTGGHVSPHVQDRWGSNALEPMRMRIYDVTSEYYCIFILCLTLDFNKLFTVCHYSHECPGSVWSRANFHRICMWLFIVFNIYICA